jgi:SAM-dependent methyltransferase
MGISWIYSAGPESCSVPAPERKRWLRHLIESQSSLTWRFDRLLPAEFQVDGNQHFLNQLVPLYLHHGALIYDVGGGRNPAIARQFKDELGLRIIGLDIDGGELAAAPSASYDETIRADIARYRGQGEADLVICQSLLEHLQDPDPALAAISSILRPGGRSLVFVPCRNAVYARLNLILPERIKRRILYGIFPEMREDHGFPAYYKRCTPANLVALGESHGLFLESSQLYFLSNYFRFCLPLHALWRAWLLMFRWMAGAEAAETFTMVFRKEQ